MYCERHTVSLTTDGDGAATGYTPVVSGRVLSVVYTKTDFANTADITVTADVTGMAILTLTDQTASGTFHPRAQVHGPTGTALTFNGTQTVNEPVPVAQERVKVVVAQGGDTKTGSVTIVLG